MLSLKLWRFLSARLNVLIYAEQVRRIVLLLDLGQPRVVLPIRRPDALLAFLHHEIHVCPARRMREERAPIIARPRGNLLLARRVRVYADDHLRPFSVAVGPRRGRVLYAA